MTNKVSGIVSFLILMGAVLWSFYGTMPQHGFGSQAPETKFSNQQAFNHVKALAREPHFVGSSAHVRAKNYIISELQHMGLLVQTQEAYALNKYGVVSHPQNILSRIEGSGSEKALLLLTHYDSAVHSSFGASDAGSGVATILEGIRAFLATGKEQTNDIIILFTDAEEVGLLGAELFMNHHAWAKDVGLALNFEARGSGGPSFMLLETNGGNKKLIKAFIKAHPEFPVTNSLAYSIYKLLPNDTDLTVLREQGNINGFNFAFIGDHFDYHTANDIPENLDKNTLAHQGSYLMPLLKYFGNVPLGNFNASEDLIYFNVPIFNMLSYPFSWIFPILILALFIFIGILIYGLLKKRLSPGRILKGFVPMFISLFASGLLAFLFWKLCLVLYPQYLEMEHGFTYNGYYYIAAGIFLALTVCFYAYAKFQNTKNTREFFIAPLILWFLVCTATVIYLKGASYFIIPVFFGLLQLFLLIQEKKPNLFLLSLLSVPAIVLIFPFAVSFPVALGLKILFATAILMVLLWALVWPVFGYYQKKQLLGHFCFLVFLSLVVLAHLKSGFSEERPKPNSLVYIWDADKQLATWNTYDGILDSWTVPYFARNSKVFSANTVFSSKYNSGFTRSSEAPVIKLESPKVVAEALGIDSAGNRRFSVKIVPNENMNRLDLYMDKNFDFETFKVNGLKALPLTSEENSLHVFKNRWDDRLLTYFAANQDTLRLQFSTSSEQVPNMVLYAAAYQLLENRQLQVPPRTNAMIPRPFVLNDAIIIKKSFIFE